MKATFGDAVENGWASEGNPTRRGYFVREFTRTGKMNPGLTWELTDGKGKFWEFKPREIGERLTVTPAADTIEHLQSRLQEAERVLEPFAKVFAYETPGGSGITVIGAAFDDFRAARAFRGET